MWGDHVGEDGGPGETRVPPNERGNLYPYGTGMGDRGAWCQDTAGRNGGQDFWDWEVY